ncbi:hypothetical protein DB459_21100 [Bradyrhizobium sp. WD16]|nr:hypothetical protein DB459_21100 [Bradyrhizobium sp. WD16]
MYKNYEMRSKVWKQQRRASWLRRYISFRFSMQGYMISSKGLTMAASPIMKSNGVSSTQPIFTHS